MLSHVRGGYDLGLMPWCSKGQHDAPASDFTIIRKTGKPFWWCKTHVREYDQQRAARSEVRERRTQIRRAHREVIQDSLWAYLLDHPCIDCGEADPVVLEFDHRDAEAKEVNVTELFHHSWTRVLREIEQCDVRCANCHRRRTAVQRNSWRLGRM